jgi:tetratricopeptide (TPR) repeat protein
MWPVHAVDAALKIVAALEGPGADRPDAAAERIKAYALLAVSYGFCGQPKLGLEASEAALALLPPGRTPMRAALMMCKVANLFPAGRYDEVRSLCAEAEPLFETADLASQPPLVMNTRAGAVSYPNTMAFQGERPDPARAELAMARALEAKSLSIVNIIRAYFGLWFAWTGREAEATAAAEETLQYCRKLAAPPYPWALYLRPYVMWQRGELDDARTLIDTYLRYSHLGQLDMSKQLIIVLSGQVHLSQGALDLAEEAFRAAEVRGREAPMAVVLMRALLGRAEVAIARREWPEATRMLQEVVAIAQAPTTRNPLHEALGERLMAEVALGQRLYTRAREHAGKALAVFTRPEQDNVIEQGHVHRVLGEVDLGQGDPVAAGASFRKAGELYHQLRNRHWLHAINRHLETLHQQPEAARPVEATPEERFEHFRGMLMR